MCGITGVVHRDGHPVSESVVRDMTARLAHRGPDGEGIVLTEGLGFGHRRLAIIDLSDTSHQPMRTEDGRYLLTYNGELYNYRELRRKLEERGHRFRSTGDTEVVLRSWSEWGVHSLDLFNGMFAFAIWDGVSQELVLARDRYGIKPVYYADLPDALVFGSEVKALLVHPDVRTDLDTEALVEYFTFQNLFTDRTLFRGVHLLPAGSLLRFKRSEPRRSEVIRYWDYTFVEPDSRTAPEEYVEELDRLFQQAVRRQLVADVEVGSYLSGGLDSGGITAIAARELPFLRTFTAGFDLHSISGVELSFDEREKAEFMSYLFKTEHYELVLKAGDMERVMPRLAWHIEEPRVGQSYPNFYVAQLASRFAPVVLSGTGGDEIFGGYPWRYYRAVVNDDFNHYLDKYYAFWQRLLPDRLASDFFGPIRSSFESADPRQIFEGVFAKHATNLRRPEDYVNHALYFEAKTFLQGLLVVEDKLSMANGLEARVPFLDNDLVDFASRVPVELKLGNLSKVVRMNENEPGPKTERYYQKTRDGKLILRRMLERHVPREVAYRIKQGFSAPDASWFKGESIDFVRRRLADRNGTIYQFLDYDTVDLLLNDHLSGRKNRRLLIWSLLSFDAWCETFL